MPSYVFSVTLVYVYIMAYVRSAVFVFVGTHLHIGSTVVILILGIVRTAFDTNMNYFAKMSTYIVTKHFYAESVTRFSASK